MRFLTTVLRAVLPGLLLAGCSATAIHDAPGAQLESPASGRFCASAQRYMSTTRIEVTNVVHGRYEDFVQSKPKVRPLETEEFHWFEDDAGQHLRMISCKMKTVDHLRAEYGQDSAGEEGSCSALNAMTLRAVLAGLTDEQRRRLRFDHGRAVILDPDVVVNDGPLWLMPFPMASVDAGGRLHLLAKAMRNDWNDPRIKDAPVRFRGTRYCHLVAPEFLGRLLLGEEQAPAL